MYNVLIEENKFQIKSNYCFFQDTDLLLIKCNHTDGNDPKAFQDRSKIFGNKKVEMVVGLQIQGPHAMKKCSAVSVKD